MEYSTFQGDFTMQGLEFIFGENTVIDFRNSCFFGDVRIRNIRFKESNLNNKFSFEDARIHKNLEIFNCTFGHVNLYCFQLVMGEFSNGEIRNEKTVKIINTYFENDAKIDFTDMELNHGKIIIKNIEHMPVTKLCMSPYLKKDKEKVCPNVTVEIIKCGIYNTLTLSNISQLTFGHSQNYSHIICDENWAYKDNDISKQRQKTKSEKCYAVKNKALIAIVNYTNSDSLNTTNIQNRTGLQKAKDCIMLKENFSNMGMYIEEDEAFILYMKYKPIVDSRQKGVEENKIKPMISHAALYKLLYIIGRYGISPLRVIYSLIVVICAFTIVYGVCMYIVLNNGMCDAVMLYSLGKVIMPKNNIGSIVAGAFLYSLANIVPFVCQFEPFKVSICIISAIENLIGTFLIGYFSVAVVRKTLR